MNRVSVICSIFMLMSLAACSKNHENLPTGFAYTPPTTPTNLQVEGGAERATLTWSYPADEIETLEEFRVYYYVEAYDLLQLIGTTSDSTYVDSVLVGNLVYCYSISAVDSTGLEGWRTPTVCEFVYSK
jgi:hypothetical protein